MGRSIFNEISEFQLFANSAVQEYNMLNEMDSKLTKEFKNFEMYRVFVLLEFIKLSETLSI